jgi:hypothetical protein
MFVESDWGRPIYGLFSKDSRLTRIRTWIPVINSQEFLVMSKQTFFGSRIESGLSHLGVKLNKGELGQNKIVFYKR